MQLSYRQVARRSLATALLLLGTNVITYAYTRYRITENVLAKAWADMQILFWDVGFLPPTDQPIASTIAQKSTFIQHVNRTIGMAGGHYYWWNKSLRFYGFGTLLILSSLMLLLVSKRGNNTGIAVSRREVKGVKVEANKIGNNESQ